MVSKAGRSGEVADFLAVGSVLFVVGVILYALWTTLLRGDPWQGFAEKHGMSFLPAAVNLNAGTERPRTVKGRFRSAGIAREVNVWAFATGELGVTVALERRAWRSVTIRSRRIAAPSSGRRDRGDEELGAAVSSGDQGFDQLFSVRCRQKKSAAIEEHLRAPGVTEGLQLLTQSASAFELSEGKIRLIFAKAPSEKGELEFLLAEVFSFLRRVEGGEDQVVVSSVERGEGGVQLAGAEEGEGPRREEVWAFEREEEW